MDKQKLIEQLALQKHPLEGGYFKRTYESTETTETSAGRRKLLTSIFYMLTDDSPIGLLHKNKSDIIHYYQLGSPVEYVVVDPEGHLEVYILGPNIDQGQLLQLTVKGNYWKGSRILTGDFSLISEAVSPGFEYQDNVLATDEDLMHLNGDALKTLKPFIKANA